MSHGHVLPYDGVANGAWVFWYVGGWYVWISLRILVYMLNVVWLRGSLDHGKRLLFYNFVYSSRVGARGLLGVYYIFSYLDGRGQLYCSVFIG